MVPPYCGVHVNIVSCERLVFVSVFVFLGGESVGDDCLVFTFLGPMD